MDADKIMTEEEKKQREMRRRERERRHRETRDKKPVSRKLDIIDQLDATSIYGTGSRCLGPIPLRVQALTCLQFSTTTDPSTLSTPTATGKAAGVRPCKHFRKTRSTTRLAVLGR
jgi:hypothetical protein